MVAMDKQIEAALASKMEGMVYCHVWITWCFNAFFVNKLYYRVENGKVLEIHDKHNPTGDTLFDLQNDCVKIGKYNPKFKYKRVFKEMSYKEITERLGITK